MFSGLSNLLSLFEHCVDYDLSHMPSVLILIKELQELGGGGGGGKLESGIMIKVDGYEKD